MQVHSFRLCDRWRQRAGEVESKGYGRPGLHCQAVQTSRTDSNDPGLLVARLDRFALDWAELDRGGQVVRAIQCLSTTDREKNASEAVSGYRSLVVQATAIPRRLGPADSWAIPDDGLRRFSGRPTPGRHPANVNADDDPHAARYRDPHPHTDANLYFHTSPDDRGDAPADLSRQGGAIWKSRLRCCYRLMKR